jgi:hypothetical protein
MIVPPSRLVPYLLRTVRVGVRATFLAIAALTAFLVLPRDTDVEIGIYVAVLIVAAGGAVVVAILPWERMFQSGLGMWALYAWSAGDIVLISIALAAAGGGASPLFILYALTTVFFAASYPPRAQVGLLAFTFACYLTASAIAGFEVDAAEIVTRMAIIGILTFISAFLSLELANAEETIARLRRNQLLHEQALEINDNIVQGLVVAKYALEVGKDDQARHAVSRTLDSASALVSRLMTERAGGIEPGAFVRSEPATLENRGEKP